MRPRGATKSSATARRLCCRYRNRRASRRERRGRLPSRRHRSERPPCALPPRHVYPRSWCLCWLGDAFSRGKEIDMTAATARAVRFDQYGGREVLYVADIEMPTPGPGEVIVEVRAAGINPGEAAIRSGAMHEMFPATFPSGQGSDLAGVVTAVGPDVTEFSVGDEVLGFSFRRSSHATHTAVPVDQLIRKPPELSWEVAGSLYVVGATAYAAVRAVDPQPGETIAVSAAAGGVGTVVVQLLTLRDVQVLGIASAGNAEWLRGHGVEPVEYGDGLARRLQA